MSKKITTLAVLVFVLCPALLLASGPDDLNEDVQEVMNEEGEKRLQDVLEKDELGENMKSEIKGLRKRELKRTAKTVALQKAVRWRYGEICDYLEEIDHTMQEIYDFGPFMEFGGKVVPPIITEAGPGYRIRSEKKATSSQKTYYIARHARLVSKTPTWRDYLMQDYASFSEQNVEAGVLPKNEEERRIWKKSALRGWERGVEQAERLYKTNLARLTRDLQGVIEFNILAEQNIVSMPKIASGSLEVKIEGDEMSVDERVFRITEDASFKDESEWKPKIGN